MMRTATWLVLLAAVTASATANVHKQRGDTNPAPQRRAEWAVALSPAWIERATELAANLGVDSVHSEPILESVFLFRLPTARALESGPSVLFTAAVEAAETGLRAAVASGAIEWFEQQAARAQSKRAFPPTDPLFDEQWHLVNTGANSDSGVEGVDVSVLSVWVNSGLTGANVTVCIVDDGMQIDHPDLAPNYIAAASYDMNDDDNNPSPVYNSDNHGTSCAGVAAGRDDGSTCGVGAAPRAGLSAVRLISKANTDYEEAWALTYAPALNDIYSNSWGPYDDGSTVAGPGPLAEAALKTGAKTLRGGKGAVYVWAGGNGRGNEDDCNADGYANSIYTISVSAVGNDGVVAWYAEGCAAHLVASPSNGRNGVGIVTTDRLGSKGYDSGDCEYSFGGTSSACPLTAGVVALVLEANPNLGWRDVQYILMRTANRTIVGGGSGGGPSFVTNAAGWAHSRDYGFGLTNAAGAVAAAAGWVNTPGMTRVDSPVYTPSATIPDGSAVEAGFVLVGSSIRLEFLEIWLDISHPNRGDLYVNVTSPLGTVAAVYAMRSDDSNDNFDNWRMMTVQLWGEPSHGGFTLTVGDGKANNEGTLNSFRVSGYGVTCAELDGANAWTADEDCPVDCEGTPAGSVFNDPCGVCGGSCGTAETTTWESLVLTAATEQDAETTSTADAGAIGNGNGGGLTPTHIALIGVSSALLALVAVAAAVCLCSLSKGRRDEERNQENKAGGDSGSGSGSSSSDGHSSSPSSTEDASVSASATSAVSYASDEDPSGSSA